MDIVKKFEKATIKEIEDYIQRVVNERDAVNRELLALNQLRDRKVKDAEALAAAKDFEEKYGKPPTQVIAPDSAIAAGKESMFGGLLKNLFRS